MDETITDPGGDDDSEDYVSCDISQTERDRHDDVTGIGDLWTPREVDRRHNGVPYAHHDDNCHRRYDVDVLHQYKPYISSTVTQ